MALQQARALQMRVYDANANDEEQHKQAKQRDLLGRPDH